MASLLDAGCHCSPTASPSTSRRAHAPHSSRHPPPPLPFCLPTWPRRGRRGRGGAQPTPLPRADRSHRLHWPPRQGCLLGPGTRRPWCLRGRRRASALGKQIQVGGVHHAILPAADPLALPLPGSEARPCSLSPSRLARPQPPSPVPLPHPGTHREEVRQGLVPKICAREEPGVHNGDAIGRQV